MKILFVNGHQDTSVGKAKFNTYYLQITNLLSNTLLYGRHHQQIIRNHSEISQFLYDEGSNYVDPKCLKRFELLDYVFIDGDIHIEPFHPQIQELVTLIKMCVKYNVKFHFNRFAFISLCYLELKNQKPIQKSQNDNTVLQGQTIFKKGFYDRQMNSSKSIYNGKRVQSKIYWKNTQFHYVCTSKVTGNKLLKNVNFPITLYCRSKWLCNPVNYLNSRIISLVETQNKSPVVIGIGNGIATISLCDQFIIILKNWINKVNDGMITAQPGLMKSNRRNISLIDQVSCVFTQQIQEDNILSLQSTLYQRPFSSIRPASSSSWLSRFSRPQTGMKKQTFTKIDPIVRNSGPYLTQQQVKKQDDKQQSKKILSRKYLSHSKTVGKFDIKNYVGQTPSQPPILHKFRTIDKSKWINKKPFFVA